MSNALARRAAPLALMIAAACGGGEQSSGSGGSGGAGTTTTATSSSTGGAGTGGAGTGGAGTGGAGTTTTATSSSTGGAGGSTGCTPGTMASCYSGPSGTENLGICKPGMKTCQSDGTYGPCTGEVLPMPAEDCATTVDDNCNGATNEGCVCTPGAMLPCYGGPPGTENKGICKDGTKTCAADGLSFGLCIGEVKPALENCLTPEDEDCDGIAPACTGDGLWAKRFGDAMAQGANAVANHTGGPVITGVLAGAADFGGGNLTSAGGNDIFVASYDYTGAFLWAKRFGDAMAQAGVDVAVDKAGNNLVIGDFAGVVDFGGGNLTSAGSTDVFVAKLDSAGGFVWARKFGNNQAQNGRGIAVDDAGNVYITGSFAGTIDFGGGPLTSAGGNDVFVAKLAPDGSHVWSKRFGDAAAQSGKAVAVDLAGNVVVTGECAGAVDFGGGLVATAGGNDVFVVSLDANGNHFWSKIFGNNAAQAAGGVAVDGVGNVVLTGSVAGSINFGGGALTSAGANDAYVAKFTQAGTHLWSKIFGGAAAENGRDVAIDRFGGVVVTGDFAGTVNFGGGALTTAGGADVFVLKLDPMGAHVWSRKYGDAQAQAVGGVAVDDSGILVAGAFAGVVNFGPGNLTSAGTNDVFVAKLAP